jgi:hypothetical protein
MATILRTVVASSSWKPAVVTRALPLSLTQSLTTPSKVAHVFDWKKATSNLLTLCVTKQSIECAVAPHPSHHRQREPIQSVPSISLRQHRPTNQLSMCNNNLKKLPTMQQTPKVHLDTPSFDVQSVTQSLQQIMNQNNVCGIVVMWPTEQQEGWNGASCGRTLHVLDHISLNASSGSSSNQKPICLYDPRQHVRSAWTDDLVVEDEWGRTPIYSTTTKATFVHCAKQNESITSKNTAVDVCSSFFRDYWPDVVGQTQWNEREAALKNNFNYQHSFVADTHSFKNEHATYQLAF